MVLCCIMGVINLQACDYNLVGVLVCLAVAFCVSMLTSVLISGVLPIIEGVFKIITPISCCLLYTSYICTRCGELNAHACE